MMMTELGFYQKDEGLEYESLRQDPLVWWKVKARKFPYVWAVAREYLAIPATSAPSERAFSTAGNVVSVRRCSLKSERVREICLLKDNQEMVDEIVQQRYLDGLERE